MPKKLLKTLIPALIMILAGVLVALIKPFNGLGDTGQVMLGTMIAALAVWIFRPGEGTSIIGAAIIFLGGTLAGIPLPDLASGFSSASLWLLISAMFLGSALLNTGLGKRIVYAFFMRFRLTYKKILIGWFIIGVLFALLTPSITVRLLILTPIAISVADARLLEKQSKGRSLIVISAWVVSIFPGIAWQNGSLFGPVFTSYLPAGSMREMATEQMWLRAMGLPWILLSVAFLAVLYIVLKPEQELEVSKEQLRQMYDDLGPIQKKEKGCLIALVFMLACLVLQTFLPITTNQSLLAALILMLFLGVLTIKDISSGISWDTVSFFGMTLSFSRIFEVSGITEWLSPILSSTLEPIAFSPLVFVLALYGICVLLRFLDIAQGWILAAILSMSTPMLFADFGLNPMVSIMVYLCAGNLFLFRYQQPWVGQVEAVCGDSGWAPRHLTTAALIYMGLAAVMLVFCRFYWPLVGIL